MTKSQKITVVGLCIAAVAVPAIVLRNRNRQSEPFLAEVPMSDGVHRYRLLKAVEGPLDYDWKDPTPPLLRMLPQPFGRPHVPFTPVHLDGFTEFDRFPGVSFYFRPVDDKGMYSRGPSGFSHPRIEFEESTGFVFRGRGPFGFSPKSHFGTAALTTSALPRRDSTLKILIHDSPSKRSSKPLVMEVPNPYYKRDVPAWEGEMIPATKSVEGYSVTLSAIKPDSLDGVRAEVMIKDSSKRWNPHYDYWLEDATGNRGRRLSPFEPAWKVHVSLEPSPQSEFASDRIWKIGAFPRPQNETFVELKPPAQIAGVAVNAAVLAGAGRLRTQNDKLSSVPPTGEAKSGFSTSSRSSVVNGRSIQYHDIECGQPFLWIRHAPIDREAVVLARLVSGDRIVAGNLGRITSNQEHSSIITFKDWHDDKTEWTLDVILATKPHTEFLVAPPPEVRNELMKPGPF